MTDLEYRGFPCAQCPWRRDSDLSRFTDADFARLERANGQPGGEAWLDAPMMACHLDQPDTSHPKRLCAGWLATVGADHLGVRFHVVAGRLPADAVVAGAEWPALHGGLDEIQARRAR